MRFAACWSEPPAAADPGDRRCLVDAQLVAFIDESVQRAGSSRTPQLGGLRPVIVAAVVLLRLVLLRLVAIGG